MILVGLLYLVIISLVYLLLWTVDRHKIRQSLRIAGRSLTKLLPMLMAIFGLVGLFQEYVPPHLVTRFLSESSGFFSLLTATVVGAVSIGPPLAAYPLAEALLKAGAWPPAIAAFILSWISIGIITLPFEAATFGVRFALLRNGISFFAAMLCGLLLGALL